MASTDESDVRSAATDAMRLGNWSVAGTLFLHDAVEKNDPYSQIMVGLLYLYGRNGWPADPEKAVLWITKAAEQNFAQAKFELSKMYIDGQVLPKSDVRAVQLIHEAAVGGNRSAIQILEASAAVGNIAAQATLATVYMLDDLGLQDAEKVLMYARPAAERGNHAAMIAMGWLYDGGWFVRQDFIEAYKWFNLASESAEPGIAASAGIFRYSVATKMSAGQIAEAQSATRNFVPIV